MATAVLDPGEAYTLWAKEYPPHAHNPLMLAEERAMLTLLPEDLSGRIVCDAGCGTGRYLLHAQRRGATQLIGFDLSEAMLRRAREQQNLSVVRANLMRLPLASSCADVTICGLTLGHLSNLEAPLAELRRVTRPNGIILCSELHPVGQSLGWERTFKSDGKRYTVLHNWRTLDDWKEVCEQTGFEISRMLEPLLDRADISPDARFDPAALSVPVALVLELRRA